MAKDITYDDLLEELSKAITGGMLEIQPGDISIYELSKTTGMKAETILKREIPEGWEIIERRGKHGQVMKCFKKI